jgi:hypothetical protein
MSADNKIQILLLQKDNLLDDWPGSLILSSYACLQCYAAIMVLLGWPGIVFLDPK